MPERRIDFLTNLSFLFWTYIVIAIAVSLHRYFLGEDHYGNYLIFKNSFLHLFNGKDLYAFYPELKIDLFKYSPTFAVLFSPFSIMPDYVGLVLWNLLNAMFLFFAIKMIDVEEKKKAFILWFILIELITSMQNYQSNALTVALIILTFVMLERKKYLLAGICIAVGFYIKVFGVLGGLLWFLYKGKGKFVFSSVVALIVLLTLPLIFVSPNAFIDIYKSWFHLLSTDASHELNHSVMSILKNWFGFEMNKLLIQFAGIILLLLPLMKWKYFVRQDGRTPSSSGEDKMFRLLFLSSILVWAVIFNHKAESATYIIAVTGCAIWFFNSENSITNKSLIIFLFILTILSPTDLFPRIVRDNYIVPYSLKALPCILIWIKIQYELLSFRGRTAAAN